MSEVMEEEITGPPERVIGTLKEQCVHRQRFESSVNALRVAAD